MLGDVGQRFIDKTQPCLEAQLVDLSDETAYSNHDVDDGLRYGLITFNDLLEIKLFRDQYDKVIAKHRDINDRQMIHEIIRRMINVMVVDLIDTSRNHISSARLGSLQDVRSQAKPLMTFSDEMSALNLELKQFLRENLYQHYRVHRMSRKAYDIITALFDAFMNDIKILPPENREQCRIMQGESGDEGIARGVADYIAGMTDRYAIVEYERIFNPRQLSFVNLIP
jgi:dGTPase